MSEDGIPHENAVRISRASQALAYDATLPAVAEVDPGATVIFETADARDGALADREPGTGFVLPPPPVGRGNPLTGPVVLAGAQPGDTLVVEILEIRCVAPGWAGAHADVNPVEPGRIPTSRGRSCAIVGGEVRYTPDIAIPLRPMVGCIGSAPAGWAPSAGEPGRFGGNLDHRIVTAGSTVFLRSSVAGGCLFIGDLHAAQGDGELSGVAVEVAGAVTVRLGLVKGAALEWPWVVDSDRVAVLTSGPEFSDARREAVEQMLGLIERCLGLQPAEALGLISAAGDLRVGQAFGGMDLTLRLEMPRLPGLDLRADLTRRGLESR